VVLVEWLGMEAATALGIRPGSVRARLSRAKAPPVGRSVDDLVTALAELAPSRVTSAPKNVIMYGYRGEYLELTVPHPPVEGGDFSRWVDGSLSSWVAPIDVAEGEGGAFHGYNAEPIEEFWILDVEGTRLLIETNWSPASPPEDVAEMRAILDSIRIEPRLLDAAEAAEALLHLTGLGVADGAPRRDRRSRTDEGLARTPTPRVNFPSTSSFPERD
jgi:hypothetical protein